MSDEQKPMPPDPEQKNEDRAGYALAAIDAFKAATGTDDEDAICDLICDLLHLCDRRPDLGEFDVQVDRGRVHYDAETNTEYWSK